MLPGRVTQGRRNVKWIQLPSFKSTGVMYWPATPRPIVCDHQDKESGKMGASLFSPAAPMGSAFLVGLVPENVLVLFEAADSAEDHTILKIGDDGTVHKLRV